MLPQNNQHINLPVLIGAVVAVLLQIILAPAISIGAAMPNFILCFVVCAAICGSQNHIAVLAFVLGMLYDLLGLGPVGLMAFCLIIVSLLASFSFSNMANSSWVSALLIIVIACLVTELLYGIGMLILGVDASFGSALIYRILPCFVYDCVMGAIMYPICSRLLSQSSPTSSDGMMIIR